MSARVRTGVGARRLVQHRSAVTGPCHAVPRRLVGAALASPALACWCGAANGPADPRSSGPRRRPLRSSMPFNESTHDAAVKAPAVGGARSAPLGCWRNVRNLRETLANPIRNRDGSCYNNSEPFFRRSGLVSVPEAFTSGSHAWSQTPQHVVAAKVDLAVACQHVGTAMRHSRFREADGNRLERVLRLAVEAIRMRDAVARRA